ncbi:hypothetical protein [Nocardioides marmoribigeumensis]|uniref:Secreted protein n=1 Tax=Nocardioides marmoribigeumensis TaxID=433649 RepID=A0ABU2BRB6_9ACTN|nr:hypothetical protein [Nocardioides marmoribigeumensis]MDR7361190.1 hypothetical protein [Nocardioides marmoribigeumensis]
MSTTIRRTSTALLTAATALVAVLVGAMAPASAQIFAGNGTWGYYDVGQATCRSRLYGNTQVVDLTAASPRALAKNLHAGGGNDAAWVRFRVFVVNASTGATVTSSGYSGWKRAWDNSPATWSGGTLFTLAGRGNYRVETRVEWWNSTSRIGWIADRTTSYRLISAYGFAWNGGSCSYVFQ